MGLAPYLIRKAAFTRNYENGHRHEDPENVVIMGRAAAASQ